MTLQVAQMYIYFRLMHMLSLALLATACVYIQHCFKVFSAQTTVVLPNAIDTQYNMKETVQDEDEQTGCDHCLPMYPCVQTLHMSVVMQAYGYRSSRTSASYSLRSCRHVAEPVPTVLGIKCQLVNI